LAKRGGFEGRSQRSLLDDRRGVLAHLGDNGTAKHHQREGSG
jgi:hypothetical protein